VRGTKIDALPISSTQKKMLKERPASEEGLQLSRRHARALAISDEDYRRAFAEGDRRQWDTLRRGVDGVQRSRPAAPPTALAISDRKAEPEPTWLLERGDFYARRERLKLGFLTVLTRSRTPEAYLAAARRAIGPGRSTGQRRALAEWITDVEHGAGALLARVIVNRVWQHHFGEGLVRTVNDFGVGGSGPRTRNCSSGWRTSWPRAAGGSNHCTD
jgi:hypothetical protein